jgi:sec-independent protein translocase protein TatB
MFDFGFSKLVLLGIVALVVIGPERLPKVARTLGHLYGRLQRYVTQVKADIHREMEAADLGNVKSEIESAARAFQGQMESGARDVEREMREAQTSIERSLDVHPAAANEPVQTGLTDAAQAPAANAAAQAPSPQPHSGAPEPSPQLELGIEEPPQAASRDRASG